MRRHTIDNNRLCSLKDFPQTKVLAVSILSPAPSLACSAVVSYLASLCTGGFPAAETVSRLVMGHRPLGSVPLTVWERSALRETGHTNAHLLFEEHTHTHTQWHSRGDSVKVVGLWYQSGPFFSVEVTASCRWNKKAKKMQRFRVCITASQNLWKSYS